MGRPQNPARRGELIDQILALTERLPLAKLTFRTVATALEVTPYTLVYHFGTRQGLIDAVLQQAVRTKTRLIGGVEFAHLSRSEMTETLRAVCLSAVAANGAAAIRFQFEGAALEGVDPDVDPHVSTMYLAWKSEFRTWLMNQDVAAERSRVLARVMADFLVGIQYGYMVSEDGPEAMDAFDVFFAGFTQLAFTDAAPSLAADA